MLTKSKPTRKEHLRVSSLRWLTVMLILPAVFFLSAQGQQLPDLIVPSGRILIANFMNGNDALFNSRVYFWNPSDASAPVTVRVFTLPLTGPSTLLGTVDLGNLEATSSRIIKLAEDILTPLDVPMPYTDDGGNLMLEFTVVAEIVRGVAQVFSSNLAFGTYPLQEIPSTPNVSPTVLVANFLNGNNEALNSRVYLWNPSDSPAAMTVRVFTLPRDGPSTLLGTVDLGLLEAESARNIKVAEDILLSLEMPLPYMDDGGNLTIEFTVDAENVVGVAQVFSDSLAFGTYPLQVIPAIHTETPDATPPQTTITSSPSGTITQTSATFSFTGSDDVTTVENLVYSSRLDPLEPSFSSFSSSTSRSYSDLAPGDYTFHVKAQDEAGNEATPATRSFTIEAQEAGGVIRNIEQFLEKCPTEDPAYAQILADFKIRRNGVLVTPNFPCSEPVSQMPESQYTHQLRLLQALRVLYYMDRGRSGHLPWTSGTLYEWIKSKIGGFDISDSAPNASCCRIYDGTRYITLPFHEIIREFLQWEAISVRVTLFAHETRHVDGFGHTSCCTRGVGCDQTYNEANLSAYGLQWFLHKIWLTGDLSVGFSCSEPSRVEEMANWHLRVLNIVKEYFCDDKPPLSTMPQFPGGQCIE